MRRTYRLAFMPRSRLAIVRHRPMRAIPGRRERTHAAARHFRNLMAGRELMAQAERIAADIALAFCVPAGSA